MSRLTRVAGAASAAAAAGAAVAAARKRRGGRDDAWSENPPRATEGPLVSDEQWNEDRRYVAEHLHPRRVEGHDMPVIDMGEGEAILYIPLMAHVEVVYARQLRDFSRDHRVVIFRRPEPTDRPVGIAERVEEARAVLDRLDIEKAHIVGRGQAAIVASEFALAHPERSLSLVTVNVGMRHEVPPVLITNGINWALLHLPIENWLIREDAWRRQVVTFLAGPEQRLTTPTLLLGADEDPRATREQLDELAAALPDCRGVHMVAHGGRFVNYIPRDEVNRLIREFYAGLNGQTQPQASTPTADAS